MTTPRRRWGPWLIWGAGALLVLLASRRVPWTQVRESGRQLRMAWVLLGIALAAVSVSVRALRLRQILGADCGFPSAWRGIALGYFGGLFLPLGGGEVVKMTALRRETGLPPARIVAAVALDRLLDAGVLAVLIAAVGFRTLPFGSASPLWGLGLGLVGAIGTVSFLLFRGHRVRDWLARRGEASWAFRLLHHYDSIHAMLLDLRSGSVGLRIAACQGSILVLDYLATASTLRAFPFGPDLPAVAPLQVGLAVMLAFALPLLPGGLGTHQAACVIALRPFSVPMASAIAYSLVSQTGHLVLMAVFGLVAMATSKPPTRPEAP